MSFEQIPQCLKPGQLYETQSRHWTKPGLHCTRKTRLKMPVIVSYSKSRYCPCSLLTEDCKGQRASFTRQIQNAKQSKIHIPPVKHSKKWYLCFIYFQCVVIEGISDPALEEIFVGRALKLGKDCYWKKYERSRSSFTKSVFAVKIFPNIVFWRSQNLSHFG